LHLKHNPFACLSFNPSGVNLLMGRNGGFEVCWFPISNFLSSAWLLLVIALCHAS